MICQVCEAEVKDGESVCRICGAVVGSSGDYTLISPLQHTDTVGGPPRGNVLGERYEVFSRVGIDALAARYRAIDQETENSVLLTVLRPELFASSRDRDDYLARIEPEIGRGGTYMPGIVDADRDGQFVFVVEPWITGPTLREVLESRRAKRESMEPAELLPVIAQLAAALHATNGKLAHGDVRAERVIVGIDGLKLMSPFIVSAVAPTRLGAPIAKQPEWRAIVAPETTRVGTSAASDRYGVAVIAFEALTRKPPTGGLPTMGGALAPVGDELRALLSLEPSQRTQSLSPLLEALSKAASMSVPRIDPGIYKRPRSARPPRGVSNERFDSMPPSVGQLGIVDFEDVITEERPALTAALAAATPMQFPLLEPSTTPEIYRGSTDNPWQEAGSDTAQYPAVRVSSMPPRRAAARPTGRAFVIAKEENAIVTSADTPLARERRASERAQRPPPAASPKRASEDLDPRLVRAALGVTLEPSSDVATMDTVEDVIDIDGSHASESLEDDQVEPDYNVHIPPPAAVPARSGSPPPPRPSAPQPQQQPQPQRPRPQAYAALGDPNAATSRPPSTVVVRREADPTALMRRPGNGERMTLPPDLGEHASASSEGHGITAGKWLFGAMLVGLLIIASAVLYAKHRNAQQMNELLRERFDAQMEQQRQ